MTHAQLVHHYTAHQVARLRGSMNDSAVRATLAHLRRGIGRAPGSMPELWEVTLSGLPDALLSRDGVPTQGEWAIHTALTLYALHQQGWDLQAKNAHREGISLGKALGGLVEIDEDMPRVKRRFDAMATADSLSECLHHLRGLVQLLKQGDLMLDYARLAEDLYYYQRPTSRDRVRLRWGQDFYAQVHRLKDEPEDNEDTTKEDE